MHNQFILNQRYQLLEPFRKTKNSNVYKAVASSGTPCFIKDIDLANIGHPLDLTYMGQQIDLLAHLSHPAWVQLYEYGLEHNHLYMVLEQVDGPTMQQWFHQHPNCLDELLDFIEQAIKGLSYLHDKHLTHLGLSQDHFFIDQNNRCRMVFIGQNMNLHLADQSLPDLRYASPELTGLLRRPLDARSDLYSLGMIMYEIITHHFPYQASDIAQFLHELVTQTPPAPAEITDIPLMLSHIIMKLIDKDPDQRYQTAAGLLSDLQKLRETSLHHPATTFVLGLNDIDNMMSLQSLLIGRQEQIVSLKSIADHIQDHSAAVMLTGADGTGKRLLLNNLQEYLADKPYIMLRVDCNQSQSSIPLFPFQMVLKSLKSSLLRLPETVRKTLHDHLQQTAALQPLWPDVPAFMSLFDTDSEAFPRSLHPAVIELLFEFLSQHVPTILIIEGIEQSDYSSLEIVKPLILKRNPHLLLIMTVNSCDTSNTKVAHLRKLLDDADGTHIHLDHFTYEQTRSLLTKVLGNIHNFDALARILFRTSSGNPLVLKEQVTNLIEAKILCKVNGHWTINTPALQQFVFPNNRADIYACRIGALPPHCQQLLSWAALLGDCFQVYTFTQFCSQVNPELTLHIIPSLHFAEQQNLLTYDSENQLYKFYNHEIWSYLYHRSDPDSRQHYHLQIAQLLEASGCRDRYLLAWHYSHTDQYPVAVQHLLAAGYAAKDLFALTRSLKFFTQARTVIGEHLKDRPQFEQTLLTITLEAHELCKATGMVDEYLIWLQEAAAIATRYKRHTDLAYVYHHLGEIYYLKADIPQATAWIERCLPLAEQLGHNHLLGLLYSILCRIHFFTAQFDCCDKYAQQAITLLHHDDHHLFEYTICHGFIGGLHVLSGNRQQAVEWADRTLAVTAKTSHPTIKSMAYQLAAIIYNLLGMHDKGLHWAQLSLEIVEKTDNLLHQYGAYVAMGIAWQRRYDFHQASDLLLKAVQIGNHHQVTIGLVFAYIYLSQTLLDAGRLEEVLPIIERGLELTSCPFHEQMLQRSLGRYYLACQDYASARKCLEQAFYTAQSLNNKPEIAAASFEYGLLLKTLNDAAGDTLITQAMQIYREIDDSWHCNYCQNRLHFGNIQTRPSCHVSVKERLEMTSIVDISQLIGSILDMGELLPKALDLAIQTVGAKRAYVFLFDADQKLQPYIGRLSHHVFDDNCPPQQIDYDLISQAVSTKCGLIAIHKATPYNTQTHEICSVLCVPLQTHSKSLGALYLDNDVVPNLFSQHEINLMEIFSSQLAIAIDNACAYQELKETYHKVAEGEAQARYAAELETKHHELMLTHSTLQKTHEQLIATQAQLIQSEKMASLGQLISGIAHEFNTPLGVILSNIDISLRTVQALVTQPHQLPTSVQTIQSSLSISKKALLQISELVKSMCLFARLDEAEWKQADIHECIDNTLSMLAYDLNERITICKNYHASGTTLCYPNQLNQVFNNILRNATQAIADTGIITISTTDDHDQMIISIADTGIGIRPEHLPHIFDPGFTTRKTKIGVGLGLTIAYQIIEHHHGNMTVQSQYGHGATFTIRLPYHKI